MILCSKHSAHKNYPKVTQIKMFIQKIRNKSCMWTYYRNNMHIHFLLFFRGLCYKNCSCRTLVWTFCFKRFQVFFCFFCFKTRNSSLTYSGKRGKTMWPRSSFVAVLKLQSVSQNSKSGLTWHKKNLQKWSGYMAGNWTRATWLGARHF